MSNYSWNKDMFLRWKYKAKFFLDHDVRGYELYGNVYFDAQENNVVAYQDGMEIGKVRNMALENALRIFLHNPLYHIESRISHRDDDAQIIYIESFFYRLIDVERDGFVTRLKTPLVRTHKWVMNSNKMYAYVPGGMSFKIGSKLTIERDKYADFIYIAKFNGYGIGEFGEKVSRYIEENEKKLVHGKLLEITQTNSGTLGAIIEMYFIELNMEEK